MNNTPYKLQVLAELLDEAVNKGIKQSLNVASQYERGLITKQEEADQQARIVSDVEIDCKERLAAVIAQYFLLYSLSA